MKKHKAIAPNFFIWAAGLGGAIGIVATAIDIRHFAGFFERFQLVETFYVTYCALLGAMVLGDLSRMWMQRVMARTKRGGAQMRQYQQYLTQKRREHANRLTSMMYGALAGLIGFFLSGVVWGGMTVTSAVVALLWCALCLWMPYAYLVSPQKWCGMPPVAARATLGIACVIWLSRMVIF